MAADEVGAVEDKLDMQAVVDEEDRAGGSGLAGVTGKFLGADEGQAVDQQRALGDAVAFDIGVGGPGNRKGLIQKHPCAGDNPRAATALVAAFRRGGAHRVGAVKRIIKAAPAGVGGVEGVAGVGDRHHQLRAGQGGDFGVDIGGVDLEILALGQQIADVLQEVLVGCRILRAVAVCQMPGVDLHLQIMAAGQQGAVLRALGGGDPGEALPKAVGGDAGAGQGFGFKEICKDRVHLQAMADLALGHRGLLEFGAG